MLPRFDCQYGITDLWAAAFGNGDRPDLGRLVLGPSADRLHAIPTFRGREALYLILRSLDLPAGARVGVPLFTCSVVARTTRAAGMLPVFIDEASSSFGISLTDLAEKARHLDALVLVHSLGYPQDVDAVKQIMAGKPIIGDCAHAFGSTYKGESLAALCHASLFSFGLRKPLGIGGGGCIVTPDASLAGRVEDLIRASRPETNLESARHLLHSMLYAAIFRGNIYSIATYASGRAGRDGGVREKPDGPPRVEVSPVLVMRQADKNLLKSRIQDWHKSRKRVAEFWSATRANTSSSWYMPQEPSQGEWNHFILPFRVSGSDECTRIIAQFRRRGIGAARIYPNCAVEASGTGYAGGCPLAERLARTTFMVPAYPRMSDSDQGRVLQSIREISRY